MKILLLTHSGDFFTIDRVQQALEAIGTHPIRINTDLYPEEIKVNFHLEAGTPKVFIETPQGTIDTDEVEGVWMRRIWKPRLDKEIQGDFRNICLGESQTVLRNSLLLLDHAIWLDPLEHISRAANKLYQLKLAVKHGLQVPATLITNEAAQALSFYKNKQDIITKMHDQTDYGMGRSAMQMNTYKVTPEHVEEFESLQYCPMTFQKEIKKACELRVVYVGGEFFTGAIDTSQSAQGGTDWRRSEINEAEWTHFSLPADVRAKLVSFMDELHLSFGALDLIHTPNDEYVFLEVNPLGEWGMLERDLDLPISKAIANTLYKQIKTKQHTTTA
ncbi:MvdC family ATP-grasp ribosomal peptide maturase [uncultured Microscilla sp.]|uniref:MvdC family ATP-grasp ribosomal peptide maturase n=1 Tax=uncultured Microscilla sp. TaxID=432653 RepID=UPI002615F795|nr:MvdC family ATP-grasp ribosomal peptide maturase [uncultured Microscilla sp.]